MHWVKIGLCTHQFLQTTAKAYSAECYEKLAKKTMIELKTALQF